MARELEIDVAPGRLALWHGMAGRSRAVSELRDSAGSAPLITDAANRAIEAGTRGAPVLVVDPFAMTPETRTALRTHGGVLPSHGLRSDPAVRAMRQALDEGKLGEPGLLRVHAWSDSAGPGAVALEEMVDLALWLFDASPETVYASASESHLVVHLGFPGGGMALVSHDGGLPASNAYRSFSLIGSRGAVYADDHRDRQLLLGPDGPRALLASCEESSICHAIDRFAEFVLGTGAALASWEDTERAASVATLVRRVARHGTVLREERRA